MNKKKHRVDILKKTNGRCAYCGTKLEEKWHVDHVIPVRRDSSNQNKMTYPELDCFENKLASCVSCNVLKSTQSLNAFRESIVNMLTKHLMTINTQFKVVQRYGLVNINPNLNVVFYFEKLNVKLYDPKRIVYLSENDKLGDKYVYKCFKCNKMIECLYENYVDTTPCCNEKVEIKRV